ncbi:MAG: hypothetical protein ACRD15_22530, partial [Vicinamibacterales bacterium]
MDHVRFDGGVGARSGFQRGLDERSRVPQDFVETSVDLSHSPLWNADLAPTPLARRTWSTYHIAALWI